MKRLLLGTISIFSMISAEHIFEFKNYKDTDYFLEESFLQALSDVFHPDIFFETGTYLAHTTQRAAAYFKEIHTVELHDGLFHRAKSVLSPYEHVTVYHGKSPDIIAQVVPRLNGTILFWLDAHYSGQGTAQSSNNPEDPNTFTAIRLELAAIRDLNLKNCIILIDDIRGFGAVVDGREYVACSWYPSIQEVRRSLLEINPYFELALVGDILFAYDGRTYHPQFSETVIACTKTRLYDGTDLTDDELLKLEAIIMSAPSHEKAFIQKVHKMIDWDSSLFWYPLVHGLAALGSGNFEQAALQFAAVKKVIQDGSGPFRYSHRRIDDYINTSLMHHMITTIP